MNFYTVWDNANNRVGIAPHKTSFSSTITVATLPLPTNVFTPPSQQGPDMIAFVVSNVARISSVVMACATLIGFGALLYYLIVDWHILDLLFSVPFESQNFEPLLY